MRVRGCFELCLGISAAAHFWVLKSVEAGLGLAAKPESHVTVVELVEEFRAFEHLLAEPSPPPPPTETEMPEPSWEKDGPAPPAAREPAVSESRTTPASIQRTTPSPRKKQPPAHSAVRSAPSHPPVPIAPRNSPPRYPELARRNGWEGRVVVRATVGADGRVISARAHASSGYGLLDRAAVETVKSWRFEPRVVAGTAVEVDVPVNFHLRGKK